MSNPYAGCQQCEDDNTLQTAQAHDMEERRHEAYDAWLRIKRGIYTHADLNIIEFELRHLL